TNGRQALAHSVTLLTADPAVACERGPAPTRLVQHQRYGPRGPEGGPQAAAKPSPTGSHGCELAANPAFAAASSRSTPPTTPNTAAAARRSCPRSSRRRRARRRSGSHHARRKPDAEANTRRQP